MPPIRRTSQRQAVLRAVKFSSQPMSAEDILARLSAQAVAQATVYRNLEWLARRGEIYRFTDDAGVTRYVGHAQRVADFQCQRCGRMYSIEGRKLAAVEAAAAEFGQPGFMRVHVTGLCHACGKATA
jgi:Fe2+ or Zn2+ uptake regulation protein